MRFRATLLLATIFVCGAASAAEIRVDATPITHFAGVERGGKVGALIFEGGIELKADEVEFSELSGLTFPDFGSQFVAISDKGAFISGVLERDSSGFPSGMSGVEISMMQNSAGNPLPRAFSRDAESVATIRRDGKAVGVRVGFENLTRVADHALIDGVPGGPARSVEIPDWVAAHRDNESLESLCIAPPASPIAGSTLLIIEANLVHTNKHQAHLLGNRDKGNLTFSGSDGMSPTDCAFLANGDLLVLERGTALISFTMRVRRIAATDVHAGATISGEIILEGSGSDIDNMEGLALHRGPMGDERFALVSDNNRNVWERTILLEFALP